ncbi:MAG TPA: hypothetical protein VH914_19740 [Acidimicrobiia bacterium]|jgi:hypothetical protein|nr:hypothetical protein [Acidimicrobiia bacterium]
MATEVGIVEKILALHRALDQAHLAHAFGGALALAWCTQQARGTVDIDVNVFVDQQEADAVLKALPHEVAWSEADLVRCVRDGQVRLWWAATPVDVFTNTTAFHLAAADRAVVHEFASHAVPFLGCSDVAVFKAFFNRTKDWADLEAMIDAGTLDADLVIGALVHYLGADDERVTRLRALVASAGPS